MILAGSLRDLQDSETSLDAISAINTELEQTGSPLLLTEKTVEKHWVSAFELKDDRQSTWLLRMRLAEAGLICAGNYADNCEFRAAGDLLVNPREIVVHQRFTGRSTVKRRHGGLSEQFCSKGADHLEAMRRFTASVHLKITKPPLLPLMTQVLKESRRVAPSFIDRLESGQRRIADALGFMAAWRVADSTELWMRLKASSPSERAFAESSMCRFGTQVFYRIGDELRRSLAQPDYRSPFLSWPHECGMRIACKLPAIPRERIEI